MLARAACERPSGVRTLTVPVSSHVCVSHSRKRERPISAGSEQGGLFWRMGVGMDDKEMGWQEPQDRMAKCEGQNDAMEEWEAQALKEQQEMLGRVSEAPTSNQTLDALTRLELTIYFCVEQLSKVEWCGKMAWRTRRSSGSDSRSR